MGEPLEISDHRTVVEPFNFHFTGELRPEQRAALDWLVGHDHAMLIAPPGTGKAVIGCALIATHQTPTIILVDRAPLAEQWRDRLGQFLSLKPRQIGQRGGGRNRTTGIVDIALLQSLARHPEQTAELFGRYGLVIVDECHHAPAASYQPILSPATTRRWVGLTATPFRADRLDPLIAFYCGPIRHEIPASDTPTAELPRHLHVHTNAFKLDEEPHTSKTCSEPWRRTRPAIVSSSITWRPWAKMAEPTRTELGRGSTGGTPTARPAQQQRLETSGHRRRGRYRWIQPLSETHQRSHGVRRRIGADQRNNDPALIVTDVQRRPS